MPRLQVEVSKAYPGGADSSPFDLSVSFETGDDLTVLFGPSGAGKTLTLECIAGFVRPDRGRIRFAEDILFDFESSVDIPARKRRFGYVFQRDSLFPHMTIRENLEFAAQGGGHATQTGAVREILEHFQLSRLAGRRPHQVSGGERQRCTIARTLVSRPRLLLLDEPARGLDISLRRQLYEILSQVRSEYGLPLVLVTHDLEEAFKLGDRMLVYDHGRVIQDGPPRSIYERPGSPQVAWLLGTPHVLEGAIGPADPDRKVTWLETADLKLCTPFLDGRQTGDKVRFCIRPERVVARPLNGTPQPNELTVPLERMLETPTTVKLEFPGGVSAQLAREDVSSGKLVVGEKWVVTFPQDSVWIFSDDANS